MLSPLIDGAIEGGIEGGIEGATEDVGGGVSLEEWPPVSLDLEKCLNILKGDLFNFWAWHLFDEADEDCDDIPIIDKKVRHFR